MIPQFIFNLFINKFRNKHFIRILQHSEKQLFRYQKFGLSRYLL
jgi:hypothetical protein